MRRLLVFFVVLFAISVPAFSQAKHPFTFDDLMALKRVGEPVPSPDGKWVLFSAVDVNLAANTKTPHIWIVPLSTGPVGTGASPVQAEPSSVGEVPASERILIADQDADRPRWAPDGKRFAFVSNKEGGSQVWIADFEAGTVTYVHKVTAIATEAGGELWSPDGKNILFTSDVYPECDGEPFAEQDCNAKKLKETQDSKVKALIFDRLLYRHWNAYKAGKRSHIFVVPVDACVGTGALACPAGAARDLTPGDYDAPVFSLGGQDNYAFSPDGQEICYASNHDKVEATSTNSDLWIVPVNNVGRAPSPAEPKDITSDNPAWDGSPLYSPDGKYIAYRSQQRPGYESDRFRLMLYDRKTGEKKNLTEDFDRWVGTYTWAPDSKKIYFGSENKGQSPIYELNRDPDTAYREQGVLCNVCARYIREVIGGFNDDLAVSPDDRTILFTRVSLGFPNQIARASTARTGCIVDYAPGKFPPFPRYEAAECELVKADKVADLNTGTLSQVAMSPLESFWFTGANGDKAQGFLVKPPTSTPPRNIL